MTKTIQELNEQRAKCASYLKHLGMTNAIHDDEKASIAHAARYRLAKDALDRAEADYRDGIAKLSTDELIALSRPTVEA